MSQFKYVVTNYRVVDEPTASLSAFPNPVYKARVDRVHALGLGGSIRYKHVIPRTKTGNPTGGRITFGVLLCNNLESIYLAVCPAFCRPTEKPDRKEGRRRALQNMSLLLRSRLVYQAHCNTSRHEYDMAQELLPSPAGRVWAPVSDRPVGAIFPLTEPPKYHNLLQYFFVTLVAARYPILLPQQEHKAPRWALEQPVLDELLIDFRFHQARYRQSINAGLYTLDEQKQVQELISSACEAEEKIPIDELDVGRPTPKQVEE